MSDPARGSGEEPDGSQGSPRRADSPAKTPEQIAAENAFFSRPVCPCEDEEPEPMSEYDVPGEWVTYTGAINPAVIAWANRQAENESNRIVTETENGTSTQMIPVFGDPQQRELCSESSSSEQSSEVAPTSSLFDLSAPSAPSFKDGAVSAAEEKGNAAAETASKAGEAASVADDGASVAGETASVADDGASVAGETASVANEGAGVADGRASVANEGAGVADRRASLAREIARLVEEGISETEEADSVAGAAASVAEEVPPISSGFESGDIASAIETALAAMKVHEVAILGGIPPQYLHEAATTPPAVNDEEEILDEWEVFMAVDNARDAAAKSELAAHDAREARRRADAAEIAGTRQAAYLEREAVRFEFYASQAAKVAIEAESKAVRIAKRFSEANEAALRAKAIARAAEKMEKKE